MQWTSMSRALLAVVLAASAAAGCGGTSSDAAAGDERLWFQGRILTAEEYDAAIESGVLPHNHGVVFLDGDHEMQQKYDGADGIIFRDLSEAQVFLDQRFGPDAPRLPGPR
ncbi:hypothetical protein DVS28_a1043 [Euzebya pacifica]|uniref:Uncharacterized protein n=1 Tax=Euzebya pacifica TaxID=1608957 RepID=A0A346XU47_9ACTN|nr:hypothetical protein [Euzebya pacifica]AXV05744.1 hypothetical protein DVS28_a1043 [Euzebya pacifica]